MANDLNRLSTNYTKIASGFMTHKKKKKKSREAKIEFHVHKSISLTGIGQHLQVNIDANK